MAQQILENLQRFHYNLAKQFKPIRHKLIVYLFSGFANMCL